jgi:hypothetical protein
LIIHGQKDKKKKGMGGCFLFGYRLYGIEHSGVFGICRLIMVHYWSRMGIVRGTDRDYSRAGGRKKLGL